MVILLTLLAVGSLGLLLPLLHVNWRRRSQYREIWGSYPMGHRPLWGRRLQPVRVRAYRVDRFHGPRRGR